MVEQRVTLGLAAAAALVAGATAPQATGTRPFDVVLCGAISVYNDTHKPPGPANYLNLIQQRARMEGFIAFDSWGRYDEICDQLRVWVDEGRMKWRAHVHDGLDATVDALNSLFTGDNIGKVMVRVE